ncbi:MAG: hypothetical protein Q4A74_09810 [Cardiobacteriaceae bacterium]|nr:hypothetical protein [Cardiobacteriaceae bacterium]
MKNLMKKSIVGLLLAGVMTVTYAQQSMPMGKASKELGEKIAMEAMQDIMQEAAKSGKEPKPEAVMKAMVDKMRANVDDMKKAATEDCTTLYGSDKASNCSCVTEKTNYENVFNMMEKAATNPEDVKKEGEAMQKEVEDIYKACDLDISVSKKAAEEMMKQAAPKK